MHQNTNVLHVYHTCNMYVVHSLVQSNYCFIIVNWLQLYICSGCLLQAIGPDSIDLLFLGSSCMFTKWEIENIYFLKQNVFLKLLYFHANFCLFFLLFLFLSLSTLSSKSGKNPGNNKAIEFGLVLLRTTILSNMLVVFFRFT